MAAPFSRLGWTADRQVVKTGSPAAIEAATSCLGEALREWFPSPSSTLLSDAVYRRTKPEVPLPTPHRHLPPSESWLSCQVLICDLGCMTTVTCKMNLFRMNFPCHPAGGLYFSLNLLIFIQVMCNFGSYITILHKHYMVSHSRYRTPIVSPTHGRMLAYDRNGDQ